MFSIENSHFDLGQIAESNQCFRINYINKGTYRLIAFGKYLEISQAGDIITFSCDEDEYNKIWKRYFDIDTDYQALIESANINDTFLNEAINYSNGIRILRQDVWETLIAFIISQRKSISSVKLCMETLSILYGSEIKGVSMQGKEVTAYAFPTPEQLYNVPLNELRNRNLGYRDVYVHDAALWFYGNMTKNNNELYVPKFNEQYFENYTFTKNYLMQINGVGNKIANCVCLFALHMLESCPIDQIMQQIIDTYYNGIAPSWIASDLAGLWQQYVFYYNRNKHNIKL